MEGREEEGVRGEERGRRVERERERERERKEGRGGKQKDKIINSEQ